MAPASLSKARKGESVYKDQSPQAEPATRYPTVAAKIETAPMNENGQHVCEKKQGNADKSQTIFGARLVWWFIDMDLPFVGTP